MGCQAVRDGIEGRLSVKYCKFVTNKGIKMAFANFMPLFAGMMDGYLLHIKPFCSMAAENFYFLFQGAIMAS